MSGVPPVRGRVLFPGQASASLLRLEAPLSLWGGVDPGNGYIINTRHPQHGLCITGTILAMPGTVGSSSSSAIMLELIRTGCAPAGIIVARADAILVIGCIAGDELGYHCPPIIELPVDDWPSGALAHIDATSANTTC